MRKSGQLHNERGLAVRVSTESAAGVTVGIDIVTRESKAASLHWRHASFGYAQQLATTDVAALSQAELADFGAGVLRLLAPQSDDTDAEPRLPQR